MPPGKCSKPHRTEQVPSQCSTSSVFTVNLGKNPSPRKLSGSAQVKMLRLGPDPHSGLFWGHQADIQILRVKTEGLSNPTTGNVVFHTVPGSQPHMASTWWATLGTSDTNVTPPPSITDTPWVVISVCVSGTRPSLPPLPQPLPLWSHHLGIWNLHIYLKSIETGTHHSLDTQLAIHPFNKKLLNTYLGPDSIPGIKNTTANLAQRNYILEQPWHLLSVVYQQLPQNLQQIPSFLVLRPVLGYGTTIMLHCSQITKCFPLFIYHRWPNSIVN